MKNSEVQEVAFALYDCLRELKEVLRSEFETPENSKPEITNKCYLRGIEILEKHKYPLQCEYLIKILTEE